MDIIKDLTSFIASHEKPLIVILGPTAAGKTAFSLHIAKKFNGEIISTDSRQIYSEMDIGTDLISPEEQDGIPHHMLAVRKPNQILTLSEYKREAEKIIADMFRRKKIPLLVGGTGLYISAITEGYEIPEGDPDTGLREQLYEEAEKFGNEFIHKKLRKLDRESAEKIHPNNLPYVVRAIEICLTTGKNKSPKKTPPQYDVYKIGINRPREEIYERINNRVDIQVKRGLIDEVKQLIKKGYDENLPSMSSLGVKEIIPYIKGEMTFDEAKEILKRNTRRYAKRQMTWFRRYDNVKWLTPTQIHSCLEEKHQEI